MRLFTFEHNPTLAHNELTQPVYASGRRCCPRLIWWYPRLVIRGGIPLKRAKMGSSTWYGGETSPAEGRGRRAFPVAHRGLTYGKAYNWGCRSSLGGDDHLLAEGARGNARGLERL